MNRFAPTSSCFLSEEAYSAHDVSKIENGRQGLGVEWWSTLLTRMGLPHNFI